MDFKFILEVFLEMFKVLPETLSLTIIAFILAIVLALIITIIDYFEVPILKNICNVYVSFFRATPLVTQLFLFYFGLPSIIKSLVEISKFKSVILALSFNASAYMKETFRGAILSVDKGQIEAAYSIGLSNLQTMRRIILPEAIRVAIPPLLNNLIDILKGTSLAFTVGIVEITAVAKLRSSVNFKYFEAYISLMIFYWILVIILEKCQKKIEKKLNEAY